MDIELSLIEDVDLETPPPPPEFSEDTKKLWNKFVGDYQMDDPHVLAILQTALESYERMKQAQKKINEDGLQVEDRFGQLKKHPLLEVERDCRRQFYHGMRLLNLDTEPLHDGPGRPTKGEQLAFDL